MASLVEPVVDGCTNNNESPVVSLELQVESPVVAESYQLMMGYKLIRDIIFVVRKWTLQRSKQLNRTLDGGTFLFKSTMESICFQQHLACYDISKMTQNVLFLNRH